MSKIDISDPKVRQRVVQLIIDKGDEIPLEELNALQTMLDQYDMELQCVKARTNFLAFCHLVYPGFKEGAHHRQMAPLLEDIAFGRLMFLAVSISPRHGKTEFIGYLFEAWYMGLHPEEKLMMATHTASLSETVGRRLRNLIDEKIYGKVFPGTNLSADSKSAGAWTTTKGGSAYFTGVGGAIAGRGSNLLVIDDPHNEQDALSGNPKVFQDTYDWYGLAFQRRQQGGRVVIIHTRWAKNDLIGSVLEQGVKNPLSPQYKYIELPMELPSGKALWPEMFNEEDIAIIKNAIPLHRWMSQYQQQPTNAETALVPESAWRVWERDKAPECEYVFVSLDSALEANKRADYSVFGVFGVFRGSEINFANHSVNAGDDDYADDDEVYHIILLDAIRKRLEYPELKRTAVALAEDWNPDTFVIEKKASGIPLIHEMKRMRLPVIPFEPVKDKYARLKQTTDLFDMGLVWKPKGYRWADEFTAEVADFPGGVHDDCVDCLSQALARFKKGAFAPRKLTWDTRPEPEEEYQGKSAGFYNIRSAAR